MRPHEEVVGVGRRSSSVGILTHPPRSHAGPSRPAVVLLNAGLIHRPGPNRLYVRLARRLADHGCHCLRFDFSGIGESPAARTEVSFNQGAVQETQATLDALADHKGIDGFVLMGICSGATIAFLTAVRDPRVRGAAIINPRNLQYSVSQELMQHAERRRNVIQMMTDRNRWWKALRGQAQYRLAVRDIVGHLGSRRRKSRLGAETADLRRHFSTLSARGCKTLFLYSENDRGRDYIRLALGEDYDTLMAAPVVRTATVALADHTFGWPSAQHYLLDAVQDWVTASFPARSSGQTE